MVKNTAKCQVIQSTLWKATVHLIRIDVSGHQISRWFPTHLFENFEMIRNDIFEMFPYDFSRSFYLLDDSVTLQLPADGVTWLGMLLPGRVRFRPRPMYQFQKEMISLPCSPLACPQWSWLTWMKWARPSSRPAWCSRPQNPWRASSRAVWPGRGWAVRRDPWTRLPSPSCSGWPRAENPKK